MRKFLLSFTVIAASMYFASCSNDETIIGVNPGEQVEIKVGARALDVIANTRAPFEGTVGTGNLLNARVIASTTTEVYASPLHDNFMNFGASTIVGFTASKAYPSATDPVFLVGLYPSDVWDGTTTGNDKISRTFTGKEDVMASNEVSTVRNDVIAGPYKSLTFHHLLTRLNLTIKAENQDAINAWGNVTSLKVVSNNKVTVTLGTGSATVAPTATFEDDLVVNPFDFYAGETAYCTTPQTLPLAINNPTAQSYALVAPLQNSDANTEVIYTIKLTTVNHTSVKEVSVPLKVAIGGANFTGNTAGKKFEVALTFKATDIQATATVKEWTAGGEGSAEVI